MGTSSIDGAVTNFVAEILKYVSTSNGLKLENHSENLLEISQKMDSKKISFLPTEVIEVLHRKDSDERPFMQINFQDGKKVLLTESLVGFRPNEVFGLDMKKIPKVVTTPDLVSVFEAIEDTLSSDRSFEHEVDILKKVFQAILEGGEDVGFNLGSERIILDRLLASKFKASA